MVLIGLLKLGNFKRDARGDFSGLAGMRSRISSDFSCRLLPSIKNCVILASATNPQFLPSYPKEFQ
jgi:hypothetical protein